MKAIYDEVVESVCNQTGLTREALFSPVKKKDIVRSRQAVYYLCWKLGIRKVEIQRLLLMVDGFSTPHTSISYGIGKIEEYSTDESNQALTSLLNFMRSEVAKKLKVENP
jgi:chromosomal replication initiation ATPase DnaA